MFKTLLSFLVAAATMSVAAGVAAGASGDAVLRVGGDRLVEVSVPAEIGTVLVANPAVADVAPLDRQRLAVIGKRPGSTSLVVFSKAGERLISTTVLVVPDESWTMKVHRGVSESSLNCAPRCVPADGTAARSAPTAPATAAPGS